MKIKFFAIVSAILIAMCLMGSSCGKINKNKNDSTSSDTSTSVSTSGAIG